MTVKIYFNCLMLITPKLSRYSGRFIASIKYSNLPKKERVK